MENCIICGNYCTCVAYRINELSYGIECTSKIARCMQCNTELITLYTYIEFRSSLYSVDNYYSFQQEKMIGLFHEVSKRIEHKAQAGLSTLWSVMTLHHHVFT